MAKSQILSGMIHAAFSSETKLAYALGWSRQRLSRITNGHKCPDLQEVAAIASAINQEFMAVAGIFLHMWSPNGDK